MDHSTVGEKIETPLVRDRRRAVRSDPIPLPKTMRRGNVAFATKLDSS
jgi:hypothetical protein